MSKYNASLFKKCKRRGCGNFKDKGKIPEIVDRMHDKIIGKLDSEKRFISWRNDKRIEAKWRKFFRRVTTA